MKATSLGFMGDAVSRPGPLPVQVPWLQSNPRLPPSGVVGMQLVAVGEGQVGMGTVVGTRATEGVMRRWAAGVVVWGLGHIDRKASLRRPLYRLYGRLTSSTIG